MDQRLIAVAYAALLGVACLASCSKSEPPPAPKSEPPKAVAPPVDEALKRLAAEVYVYAYPLVLTDVTREVETAATPTGTFRHQSAPPDAATKNVASPNADFLYSQAWLDLSTSPVVLSVPDTRGRYVLIAMLDAWTNVAASLGTRTTGTESGKFAIVGPHWKGKLPGGVSEVRSPTDLAWLFGRIQVTGAADRGAAVKVQNAITLSPLPGAARPGKKTGSASPASPGAIDAKTAPRDRVSAMDSPEFFTRFAMLLAGNPPAGSDAAMREKIKQLGIEAGHPFEIGKLDPAAASAVAEGAKSALAAIAAAARNGTGGDLRNGWRFDIALGRWGEDYGKRAVAAHIGLGLNAPEDAIFMATHLDAAGHPLEGAGRYVLHFDRGNGPPADGFWSLSLYDDQRHFVANAINRYNIGSGTAMKPNADGSLDIYIQNADPGPDKAANWLPAPKDGFNLILRIYWPKPEVVGGKWFAPGVRRLS